MSQVRISDGTARLTVGAAQPSEAREMATRYLERRGWTVGQIEVGGGHRAKVGIMGYRVWRVVAEVSK